MFHVLWSLIGEIGSLPVALPRATKPFEGSGRDHKGGRYHLDDYMRWAV